MTAAVAELARTLRTVRKSVSIESSSAWNRHWSTRNETVATIHSAG
jgi:hypothetical protein